jgi:hypothetical protein
MEPHFQSVHGASLFGAPLSEAQLQTSCYRCGPGTAGITSKCVGLVMVLKRVIIASFGTSDCDPLSFTPFLPFRSVRGQLTRLVSLDIIQ